MTVLLQYAIAASQRISAGHSGAAGNLTEAHQVLTGSVVRGALATRWRAERDMTAPDVRDRFERLFEGSAVFAQAIPLGAWLSGTSTIRCKYPLPTCTHPPTDLAFEEAGERCPGGVVRGSGWEGLPPVASTTRAALDPYGAAKTGSLYTRQVSPARHFTGHLVLDDDVYDDDLQWLTSAQPIWLGGNRSVQGRARWTASRMAEQPPGQGGTNAVVRCASPMIAVDDYGAATLDPAAELRRLMGSPVQVHTEPGWLRSQRLSGWHAPSGMPKPEEWALAPGSTLRLSALPEGWRALVRRGVGLRTSEGYGQLVEVTTDSAPPGPLRTDEDARAVPAAPAARQVFRGPANAEPAGPASPIQPAAMGQARPANPAPLPTDAGTNSTGADPLADALAALVAHPAWTGPSGLQGTVEAARGRIAFELEHYGIDAARGELEKSLGRKALRHRDDGIRTLVRTYFESLIEEAT